MTTGLLMRAGPGATSFSLLLSRGLRSLRGALLPAGMLALAMGVVLALGSLYETVVLRSIVGLPGLVSMQMVDEDHGPAGHDPSPQELKDIPQWSWLMGKPVQQDIRVYRVEAGGATRSVLVAYASSNYFTTLGIHPVLGRTFSEAEPEAGALLSWSAWQNAQGRMALGDPITVDGVTMPVIGVLPKGSERGSHGLNPGYDPEVWVSLESRARSGEREARFFKDRGIGIPTFGLLRPGVSVAQAQAAFEALMPSWKAQRNPNPRELHAVIRSAEWMGTQAWGSFLPGSSLLWLASSLLVLMAAINVGNLQVAKWMKERHAWSIRVALGAAPLRLALELSGAMAWALGLGALGAIPMAWLIQRLIARFPPPSEFPMSFHPQWHGGGFLWALGLMLLLLLALALPLMAMAWIWFLRHSRRVDARQPLGGLRWRQVLLGTQIGLSVMLLCGTLTSLRALHNARRTPLGLDVRGVHAFSFAMPLHLPGGRRAMITEWTRMSEHFQALSKVVPGWEAACVTIPPCECFGNDPQRFTLLSPVSGASQTSFFIQGHRIHSGAFSLLRIPLMLGRDFADTDSPDSPTVAIVTASTAQVLWPGQNPLGQVLEDDQGRRCSIVGVVADHLWGGLPKVPSNSSNPLHIFLCGRQRLGPLQTLMIRSPLPATVLRERVEREVALLDPRLAIERAEPLEARVERMLQPQRLAATLFSIMGATALMLCLTGLYALQRYLTLQRLQEIGLRMALGATPRRIRMEFFSSLRLPLGLGLGVGGICTGLGWHLLRSRITGIPPLSISNLAWTLLALLTVALGAAWLPLRHLERLEPTDLLRDSGATSPAARERLF